MLRRIFKLTLRTPFSSIPNRNFLTNQIRFKFATIPNFETSDAEEQFEKYWDTWEKGINTLKNAKRKPLSEEEYVNLCKEIPYLDVEELDQDSSDAVKYFVGDLTTRANEFSLPGQLEIINSLSLNEYLNVEPYIIPFWRAVTQFFLEKYDTLKFTDKLRLIANYSIVNYYDSKIKELIEKIVESLRWVPPTEYENLPPVAIFATARCLRHKGWGDTMFINVLCVLVVRNKHFWGMDPRVVSYFLTFLEEEQHEPHIQLLIKCTERVLAKAIEKGKFNNLKSAARLVRYSLPAEHVSKEFKLKVEQQFLSLLKDPSQPKDLKSLMEWLKIFGRHTFQIPELEQKLKDMIFELWKTANEVELAHILWILSWKLNDNIHHIKMVLLMIEDKIRKRDWEAPGYLELIMIELNNSRIVYPKLMKKLEDIAYSMLEDREIPLPDIVKIASCFPPHIVTNPKFHEKIAERLSKYNTQVLVDTNEELTQEYEEKARNEVDKIEIEEEEQDFEHQMYGYNKGVSQDPNEVRMRELKRILDRNKADEFYGFGRVDQMEKIEEMFTEEKLEETEYLMDFITTVYENKFLQKPEIIETFEPSILDKIVVMNEYNMFRVVFAFLKLNCASTTFYNTCIEFLNLSMHNFSPIPTARSSFAFGMIGKEEFFMQLYQKIRNFVTSNAIVRIETDYGMIFRFRGMMSPHFSFNEKFPAFALAEMLWGLTAFEIKDREIWNEKLYQLALEMPGIDVETGLNKWSRARDYGPKEQVRSLDPFDYGLLMQALALNPPHGAKHKVFLNKLKNLVKGKSENFIKKMGYSTNIKSGFIESVKEAARSLNLEMDDRERHFLGMKLGLKVGQKELLLYDKDHYLYKSEGYENRTGEKDLFKYWILKKKILQAAEIPFVEIYHGEWEKMLPEEQEEFLHNEYKKKSKK